MTEKTTQEAILNIKDGLDKAQDSVVPFAVVQGDDIAVAGDANETKANPRTYEIEFRVPQKKDDGTYEEISKSVEYKNVFITPRQEMKAVKLIAQLMPYFRKINNNGTVGEFTNEEMLDLIGEMEDKVIDTMYDLVATVLNIDPALKDYMMPGSVLVSVERIIRSNPATVNEADTFFG